MIEKFVVVPINHNYKEGIGYTGPLLRTLGFPPGPYTRKVAEIFVRQAAIEQPKLRLKVVDYNKG